MESTYIKSALKLEQCPPEGPPEFAIIGRSNCGKSSLVNALLGRKRLAFESSTPGRTTTINFFQVRTANGLSVLADLPGYGYSSAGNEERRHWQRLVTDYLKKRTLVGCLFLLDSRRILDSGTLAEDDRLVLSHLASRPDRRLYVALTKVDKLSRADRKNAGTRLVLSLAEEKVTAETVEISSLKGTGITELRKALFGVP